MPASVASSSTRSTIIELNGMDAARFVGTLSEVFEHSPWVAERVVAKRPFADTGALHAAMVGAVHAATRNEQLQLIRAHPELAGREAIEGALTVESASEQGRLGLTALSPADFRRMAELNHRYRDRFGFPCIIALALQANRDSVFQAFEARLANDEDREIANALDQIGHIAGARLRQLVQR